MDEYRNITNYVAVKEDISQKKNLERLKVDVERIMRHDLKSPLNGIIGLPQILEKEDNITGEQAEMLRSMEQAGRKMLNMINLSLDMFKMEMGSYEYQPQKVDALAVIREIIADNQSRLTATGLDVAVLVDGDVPEEKDEFTIWSEERLLYNMLSNLFINAVDASPAGENIGINLERTNPPVITLGNKGSVPREMREDFFQKYATFGKRSGTGLGTYSAKLMADTMGYDIRMETSEEENLTRIKIYIPEENPRWDAG
jgi:signal transduction histidine kinase